MAMASDASATVVSPSTMSPSTECVRVTILEDWDRYVESLREKPAVPRMTFNAGSLTDFRLRELDATDWESKPREVAEQRTLYPRALQRIEKFFAWAESLDPQRLFAFASRVPLACPDYLEVQKLFLLDEYVRSAGPGNEILVYASDPDLRSVLQTCFAEDHNSQGAAGRSLKPGHRAWARLVRTVLRAFGGWITRLPGGGAGSHRALFFSPAVTDACRPDPYFGRLFAEMLADGSGVRVVLSPGSDWYPLCNTGTARIESFLKPVDLLRLTLHMLRPANCPVTVGSGPGQTLEAAVFGFMARGEVRRGDPAQSLVIELGIGRALSRIRPDAFVYPFENRNWEKRLARVAHNAGVRSVGYQHSSVTPRHLAFGLAEDTVRRDELPDAIVTVGPVTQARLVAETSRFHDLPVIEAASLRRVEAPEIKPPGLGILFAISSSRSESLRIIRFAYRFAGLTSIPILVRAHPTIPIHDIVKLYDWPEHVQFTAERTLQADLDEVRAVAFASSTVVIEGMLCGRLPIYVDIGDIPSGDPIPGEFPFKRSASSPEELRQLVLEGFLDGAGDAPMGALARNYAESYLSAPSEARLQRFFEALFPVHPTENE